MDSTTRYALFGGGAGGGKSWLVCEWITYMCLEYPGTKWFIGREELKRLMGSTFLTLMKVFEWHKIPHDQWELNGQYNYLTFKNGSRIDFLDVKALPGDPLFERFGSMEFTGGALEEIGEINFAAFDNLKPRIGRCKNPEYGIPAKILLTCNPKKNWAYSMFYKPFKEGKLPPELCFIQSLYNENKYTAEEYGRQLAGITDKTTRDRLMHGEWEYEDDPARLFEYDAINDIFTNRGLETEEQYLSCDIARYGSDKCVLIRWKGLRIAEIIHFGHSSVPDTAAKIDMLASKNNIRRGRIVADDDGIGGGIVDILKGIVGFVNNARPIEPREGKHENFANLKSQCYFKLAEYVAAGKIGCGEVPAATREMMTEELEQIKRKNADKDGLLCVIGKEEIKEKLGRSTDFSDALMMRMYFELKKTSAFAMATSDSGPRGIPGAFQSPMDQRFTEHLFGR